MSAAPVLQVEIPEKLGFLFEPFRYKVAYGGRGGSKSWAFARALLIMAYQRRLRVLCAREFQMSISDSVHKLLADQIDALGLGWFYLVEQNVIRGRNGSEFIFRGLHHNAAAMKSMEGVDIAWVEEAETVCDESWRMLIPTIRQKGSEIWISFNPRDPDDPTYRRFVAHPPPNAMVCKIDWQDNPWFPPELAAERDHDYEVDPEMADHVWGGNFAPPLVGRVYAPFRVDKHVRPVDYDRALDLQLWVDFNVHAMRWLIVQAAPRDIRVLDEIHLGRNSDTEQAADDFLRRVEPLRHRGAVIVCGDATGNARRSSSTRTDYAIITEKLRAAGLRHTVRVPAANPPVLERVRAVNYHLAGREGRSVVIDPSASELIADFVKVGWKEGAADIDKADPERTHASDAFGYGIWVNDRPHANLGQAATASPASREQHRRTDAASAEW